jgi:hypothetical protein
VFDGYCSLCRIGLREVWPSRSITNRATLAFGKRAKVYPGKAPLRDIRQAEVAGEYIEKKPVDNIDRGLPGRRQPGSGVVEGEGFANVEVDWCSCSLLRGRWVWMTEVDHAYGVRYGSHCVVSPAYAHPAAHQQWVSVCNCILDDMRSDLGWYGSRVAMEGREALACKGDGRHDERLNVGL